VRRYYFAGKRDETQYGSQELAIGFNKLRKLQLTGIKIFLSQKIMKLTEIQILRDGFNNLPAADTQPVKFIKP
jgi:hypothetical protein